jgi:aminoglycoside 6'-N-acetyltransferase
MSPLRGRTVVLREVEARDAGVLRDIHATPEVSMWWGQPDRRFPFDDDPGSTRLAILSDDVVVGLVEFAEETEPDHRYASVDVFVDPRRHRQGIGADAVATVVRHLVDDRGHHRVTMDPAVDNLAAVACYESLGFRPVGVMESAWRDAASGRWRDGLLMELVFEPNGGRG